MRESGAIEQDADMVCFVYRPEYYGFTEDEQGNSLAGTGQIIVAKHRNGALKDVNLRFIDRLAKFCDLENNDFDVFGGLSPSNDFDNGPGGTFTISSKMNDEDIAF